MKFNKQDEATAPKANASTTRLDSDTMADIEDKLSRAREIQLKGLHLELRVETLEKQEQEMAEKNRQLEEAMKSMSDKYANIDDLIEARYRSYVLEQQLRMKMSKKNANGNSWLENLSEMDRRAEEKRMIMKMRAAEHAKKRSESLAAEEAAADEANEKIRLEKLAKDVDSDDDGSQSSKKKKRRHRPKIEKLNLKGGHLDGRKARPVEKRIISQLVSSLHLTCKSLLFGST